MTPQLFFQEQNFVYPSVRPPALSHACQPLVSFTFLCCVF